LGFGVGLTTPHSKKLIVTKVKKRKSWKDLTMVERVGDRWEKMEGSFSTGQSPQWAVVPVEEEVKEYLVARLSIGQMFVKQIGSSRSVRRSNVYSANK
jgi:hypothetical protein